MTNGKPEHLVERVQQLIAQTEAIADPFARESTRELIGAIIELYGEGLGRIFHTLHEAGDPGEAIRNALAHDGVVASLLLIHGLYPVSLETRVNQALDKVRPYMASHGGSVELLSLDEGVAHLRLQGTCHGCSASAATLELAIKQALEEEAPDLSGIEVEGVVEPARATHGPPNSSSQNSRELPLCPL
ncbi:MAG: NifU family protein [Gemmatimonadales bacterium]